MSYQECLKALKKNGASDAVIDLIATFLTNRTMSVKVGDTLSSPREVWGGCPQGLILGVYLFNVTIDDLEEDCPDILESANGIPTSNAEEEEELWEDEGEEEEERPAVMSTTLRRNNMILTALKVRLAARGNLEKERKSVAENWNTHLNLEWTYLVNLMIKLKLNGRKFWGPYSGILMMASL